MATAVRIRQCDCRPSKQDRMYPSDGILLLRFSRPKKKKRMKTDLHKNIPMRSFLKNMQDKASNASSCAPHVVREGLDTGQQPSMELQQETVWMMK